MPASYVWGAFMLHAFAGLHVKWEGYTTTISGPLPLHLRVVHLRSRGDFHCVVVTRRQPRSMDVLPAAHAEATGGSESCPNDSLLTNADDRLPADPLGRVEGGDGIVEGRDVADVRPQSSVP